MQSLLRSSKAFRFTVPSHLESPFLFSPVQQTLVNVCHRLSTEEPGSTEENSPVGLEIAAGQKVILRWQNQQDLREASEADIRGLLHAAVRLRRAKAPGVTDQLLQLVMKCAAAKDCFLKVVCEDFGVQGKEVDQAVHSYLNAIDRSDFADEATLRSIHRLRQASQPVYATLFVPISNQPGGIKFLTDLRADVLAAVRKEPGGRQAWHLRALSDAIKESLSDWFSVGLLSLQRISWQASPAALLEKVMRYESVHPYGREDPWGDLKRRLAPQRRVFGFFHASMPREPLVLLHTALMPDITATLADILCTTRSQCRPEEAKAAVFYSISSTQKGLAGIDLGNFLIKQASLSLLRDFPQIEQLATLSPVPGFAQWLLVLLEQQLSGQAVASPVQMSTEEEEAVRNVWQEPRAAAQGTALSHLWAFQAGIMDRVFGSDEAQIGRVWKPLLLRLMARYLLVERRRRNALDPVANFHLCNGAEVWRINWKAYSSPDSLGMMVNYRYVLDRITANNQAYVHLGDIAASQQVSSLLET